MCEFLIHDKNAIFLSTNETMHVLSQSKKGKTIVYLLSLYVITRKQILLKKTIPFRKNCNITNLENFYRTLKYRINGEVRIIGGGGLEMVRHNNNRGVGIIGGKGLLGEIENSPFLR